MTDASPLISIIIPTYKRAQFLKRAITSVLDQTYRNLEIIVVDDNDPESDGRKQTAQVMQTYISNPKVHYICHPCNKNGAAARNTGITSCHGEFLCFLDDDDWYLPEKIEEQFHYMREHPQFNAVYCGCERDGRLYQSQKTGDLSFELLSGINVIYTNTIMMKRKDAIACGGWDERFRRNQEAAFLLRFFSAGGKIGALPKVLVRFDVSCAENRSAPLQFEKDFELFLDLHQENIRRCSLRYPDAYERIYSYRYRGVLLNYIKHGSFIKAFFLYRKISKRLPRRFRNDCAIYIKRRLLGQMIFKEFEEGNGSK